MNSIRFKIMRLENRSHVTLNCNPVREISHSLEKEFVESCLQFSGRKFLGFERGVERGMLQLR